MVHRTASKPICCAIMNKKRAQLPRKARRWAVINALKACKWDVTRAARITGNSLRYVKKWKTKYSKTKNVDDSHRCGRPRLLDAAQVEAACTAVAEQQSVPKATALLKQHEIISTSISCRTVFRAVQHDMELAAVEQRPILTAQTRNRRLAFCQQHHDSNAIIAVDSTYLTMHSYHKRRRVWVRKGTKPVGNRPLKSQQLHVYAGITAHGKTSLMRVTGTTGHPQQYQRYDKKKKQMVQLTGVGSEEFLEVFQQQLAPQADLLFAVAGVQQHSWLLDGAPAHTAAATKKFMSDNNISVLQGWPANSPDLNPIENAWAWLKRQVYAKQYSSLDEMWKEAQRVWAAMPPSMCKNLMDSLSTRKRICIERSGGYTGY